MKNLHLSLNNDWHPKYLSFLTAGLVAAYLTTITIASKQSELFGIAFSVGTLTFPFVLVIGDLISEIYGYKRSRQAIYIGFFSLIYYTIITQLAIYLPSANGWNTQEAYETILGAVPRITAAGLITYLFADLANAYVLSKMKILQGSKGFQARAVASTAVAQGIDSIMFFPLAFYGILPNSILLTIIFTSWFIKVGMEIICLPLTNYLVKKIKEWEGVEHFDEQPKGEVILKS